MGIRCAVGVLSRWGGGAQADEDTAEARTLADQYQPIIIEAEKDKRDSDFHFQEFAHATHEASPPRPPPPRPTPHAAAR